jgi:hypothetical protein
MSFGWRGPDLAAFAILQLQKDAGPSAALRFAQDDTFLEIALPKIEVMRSFFGRAAFLLSGERFGISGSVL